MEWLKEIFDRILAVFPRIWLCGPHEAGVIITFGKYISSKGAGIYIYWPLVQRIIWMDIKTQIIDLPCQSVRTKCGSSVVVSGAIQYRIIDVRKAAIDVQDADKSIVTLALGITFEFVKRRTLEECTTDTDGLRTEILKGIREASEGWGLKIERIFITDLDKTRNIRILTNIQNPGATTEVE
jgi:regulator of protease activity HflC (stomatin/prohibitin superfamily)